jgi:hypothetical protein
MPENEVYMRDITQAYAQLESKLERNILLHPVAEIGLPEDNIVLCEGVLYGVRKATMRWYFTHADHHRNNLGMEQSRADRCLFYRHSADGTVAIVMQVDDTLGSATKPFLEDEERESKYFVCKPRLIVTRGVSIYFNGTKITRQTSDEFTVSSPRRSLI